MNEVHKQRTANTIPGALRPRHQADRPVRRIDVLLVACDCCGWRGAASELREGRGSCPDCRSVRGLRRAEI